MSVRKLVRDVVMGLAAVVAVSTAARAAEPVRLYVTVDKAELVNLPALPISKIALTNPGIADVYVINPTQILLSGKQAGTTSLTCSIRDAPRLRRRGDPGRSATAGTPVPSESHAVVQRGRGVAAASCATERAWVQPATAAEPSSRKVRQRSPLCCCSAHRRRVAGGRGRARVDPA
jgi:hypothetical protein